MYRRQCLYTPPPLWIVTYRPAVRHIGGGTEFCARVFAVCGLSCLGCVEQNGDYRNDDYIKNVGQGIPSLLDECRDQAAVCLRPEVARVRPFLFGALGILVIICRQLPR